MWLTYLKKSVASKSARFTHMEFVPIGSPFSYVFLSTSLFLTFGRCKMIVCIHSNEMLWLLLHSRAVQVSCRQYSILLRASARIRKEKHTLFIHTYRHTCSSWLQLCTPSSANRRLTLPQFLCGIAFLVNNNTIYILLYVFILVCKVVLTMPLQFCLTIDHGVSKQRSQ